MGDTVSGQETPAWHALSHVEVLAYLHTSEQGLRQHQVQERLERYGPNRLPTAAGRSAWLRFISQFHNVLIYILLLAGAVTLMLGHWIDAGVILGVVIVNALIGFIQEGKAEQAMEAVRRMLSPSATVLRDGHLRTLPADTLVPGDIVQVMAGDRVPADLRLLEIHDLHVDEAALTGESLAVEKATAPVMAGATLGDRACMAYSGTLVTRGQGRGVVVATGAATEIGRISGLLSGVETLKTPLLEQIDRFGRWLSLIILAIAGMTFIVGVWGHGEPASGMFLAAVALVVAAIPEGLPAIITITLALGVQRMAGRNVIIRRLTAVETLGAVTVICSDKTGTLTRNEMMVQAVRTPVESYRVTGNGYEPHGGFEVGTGAVDVAGRDDLSELLLAALLCNDATLEFSAGQWTWQGDPMEVALLTAAHKAGLQQQEVAMRHPRLDVLPFDASHRLMATLNKEQHGKVKIYVKGAPEAVLAHCVAQYQPQGDGPMDRAFWDAEIHRLGRQGYRVLGVAVCSCEEPLDTISLPDLEKGLVFLGLVGLIDPPREDAITAVAECRNAGIKVKMITGDHAVTAAAVGRQLGIGDGEGVLSGEQIARLGGQALQQAAEKEDVFARASPEHKLRLVEALQAGSEVVAMTGDGVNDAPALKRADVGVAMGLKGTEAAKEAAEIVLTDDNFASIVAGVEEGRTVYDNIKKAILFILPTNGAEALVVLLAVLTGHMLPLTPVQILWVNMITAVTLALALAFEPAEDDIMQRPPRARGESLLSRFLAWRILFVSLLLVIYVYGLFLWLRDAGASLELARTVAVNALVGGEIVYLFNTRFFHAPSYGLNGLLGSRPVLIAVVLISLFQLLFTYSGLAQTLFGTEALRLQHWIPVLAGAGSIFLLIEFEKALFRRRRGSAA